MSKVDKVMSLIDKYNQQPVLKGLVQAISYKGVPIGPIIDAAISVRIENYKAEKLHIFFDELNSGDIELTEDIINSNDFLHAYFSTVEYVLRTRTDEKVKRFAKLILELFKGNLELEVFEDYNSILNELTDREFALLALKRQFELNNEKKRESDSTEIGHTLTYWCDFYKEASHRLNISREEFNSILVRVQRTGCYKKLILYIGSGDEEDDDEIGDTTVIFRKIYETVEKND